MSNATAESPIDRTTRHLDEQGISYEVLEHEQAFSAASEAVASGVRPDNAAKSVLLHDEEGYRLAVTLASDRLDMRKLSNLLETSKARVRMATEDEMRADFPQFELGAIPPLGEMLPAPEIIDCRVLDHERVLCNGGDHTHSVLLDPNEIVRASGAQVADVCED
jgi:prolyl-tRNA editing enzyme YbaK/EbsC (Cys-tRNA(Pro) deacylase)